MKTQPNKSLFNGAVTQDGERLNIAVRNLVVSKTPEEWQMLQSENLKLADDLTEIRWKLNRCKPSGWLANAKAMITEKATDADAIRSQASGRTRDIAAGLALAYRDVIGILATFVKDE